MSVAYQTSYKEGLEPQNPLLRDMLLLTGAVFFQVYIFRLSSRTALAAQFGASTHPNPNPRQLQGPPPVMRARSSTGRFCF